MGLQPLRTLTRIADCPDRLINLSQDGLDLGLTPLLTVKLGLQHFEVLRPITTEAQAISKGLHNYMVGQ